MNKKLFRKQQGSMLGGVCSGLGEYLRIDPLFIRIFFVLWAVTGGSAVLVYLILWVVIPSEGDETPMKTDDRIRRVGQELSAAFQHPNSQLVIFAGIGLIGMGAYYLLRQANFAWLAWFRWDLVWPFFLVVAGIVVLVRALTRKD
jgi:phage shock protein C